MTKSRQATWDAIIIGAGIVGSSIAFGLSRQGYRTLNVDALPAAGFGSTSNSSGIVRPFYSALESCALAHEARSRWLRWPEFLDCADERGHARYDECGMLMLLAEGDGERFRNTLDAMREVGVAFDHLGRAELAARFPAFDLASYGPPKPPGDPAFGVANAVPLSGGIFIREAGYVADPQLAAHNLQRAAEALGARFEFNAKIGSVDRSGARVCGVTTQAGRRFQAPVVVNAAGPHSGVVNGLAGVLDGMRVSTRPMRHEVAHVPLPGDIDPAHHRCVVGDGDAGVYLRPDIGDHVLVGSLDPPCDPREYVDADDYNTGLTEQWTRQLWRAAQRMPSLPIPNRAQGLVGLYDATPDWIPVYDKSSLPGFYMAVGTSGNQFKNAPVIGDLMAALITACENGRDHDRDPVTLYLPHLDRRVSLGFFSRLREQHRKTSGTVLA